MLNRGILLLSVVLALIVAACAPKSSSSEPPMPTPATVALPAPAKATTPAPTSEEANWAKVVAEARKEGRVTLYTFTFTGDTGRVVAAAFESRYGIKVEMVTGVGAMLLERIRSEGAARKFVADTYDTDVAFVLTAKREGLTEPAGLLPMLQARESWNFFPNVDKEGHLNALGITWITPFVNTALVKAGEEPKSFQDVLAPKWKGKIVTGMPATDPLLPRLYAISKRDKVLDDNYFRQLGKQDMKVAATVRDADGVLMRGEASLRMLGAASIYNPFIQQGAHVKPVMMEEGAILIPSRPIALVKNGPHPNAARVLINWLLSPEGQLAFHKTGGTTSHRKDVPDFSPEGGKITPKKAWVSDLDVDNEVGRLQREKVLEKLLGLE